MIPSSSLSEFFAGLRSIGLFTRLFSWKKVIRRGDDAYARYQAEENEAGRRYREIEIRLDQLSGELQRERGKNASLEALRDAERKSSQDTRDRFEVTARELEITRGKLFGLERARDEQSLAETERRQEEMARYRSLESAYAELAEQFSLAKGKIAALESLRDEQLSAEASRRKEEAQKYQELKENLDEVTRDLIAAKEQLSGHESVREEQAAEYNRKIERINTLYDQLKSDRETLANEQMNLLVKKQEELAVSWQKHETEVAESIRTICRKHDFVWCEKCEYPHQGTPDNVVLIGKMYTIFDAKSPKNPEELENFPTYLKNQAEAMKKYCKHDDVRKEVFLVVPSSTLDVLTTYQYDLAEYVVYVITPESLIPILQTLRQIENYEFTDTMSPEDQDKLCRFIGKLSHATKRKIQIDTYFSRELIDALRGIDMIPQDFAAEIGKYEQKAKLNPPMEKRVKMIEIEDVENEVRRMETEIAVRTAVGE